MKTNFSRKMRVGLLTLAVAGATLTAAGQGINNSNIANLSPATPTTAGLLVPTIPALVYVTNLALPTTPIVLTNGPVTTYLTNQACRIYPGYGLGLWVDFNSYQATNNFPFTVNLKLSPDGTNYTTTNTISFSPVSYGSNHIMLFTNFPSTVFDGAAYVSVDNVSIGSYGTNVINVNSVKLSHHQIPVPTK